MAGKELGRREVYSLVAASMLLNALLSVAIFAALLGGPGPVPGSAGDAAGGSPLRRFGRKLQQVEVDPAFQNWRASVFSTAFLNVDGTGLITITRPVTFLGGVKIVGSTGLEVTGAAVKIAAGGSLTTDNSCSVQLGGAGAAAKLAITQSAVNLAATAITTNTLGVSGMTELGTTNRASADKTAVKVFGNIFMGVESNGRPYRHRTVIYPGKASMSYPSPNDGPLAKASLGRALDDNFFCPSPGCTTAAGTFTDHLTVPGSASFATYYKDAKVPEDKWATAVKVTGNIFMGNDAFVKADGKTPYNQRTVIYPGKASFSWNSPILDPIRLLPTGMNDLAKTWIGKALDDPNTGATARDQLSVWGMSALGTATRTKPEKLVAKVFGNMQFGIDGATASGKPFNHRTVISPGKCSMSWNALVGTTNTLAKTWVGKAFDDDDTRNQLSVYGNVNLVTSRPATAKPPGGYKLTTESGGILNA